MDENTLIARFVIPALISAVISLIVAITTSIIQTKNNNKSIEAASKRLEETHKYQLERDEENRNHQLKMIETQFTREHRINRKNRRTDFIYSEKKFLTDKYEEFSLLVAENLEWSLNLLNQTTYDLDNKDYQLPSPIKIHSATILSALYFPEFQDMLLEVHKTQFDMLETANNFLQAKRDGSNIVWLHSKEKSITIKDPHEMARKFDKEFFPIMQKESLLLDTLTENIKSNAYRYRYNYRERNVLQ